MTREERASCIITIELLRKLALNVHGVIDVIDSQNCDKIIEMLNNPEPQWIPCSEKLPEEGHEVLACLTDWKTGEQKRVVSYRIDFNMWHGYGRYNEKCVAWMPLPEPWRGDAE